MFVSEALGLGGHFSGQGFNCPWCESHTDLLWSDETSTPRSLGRLYQLSHTFDPTNTTPFTCPSCNFFCDEGSHRSEDPPACAKTYRDAHFGVEWHQPPLLHIPPRKWIVCVLHLLLSCTKLLFKECIVPLLVTEDRAKRLNDQLAHLRICIPRQSKRAAMAASDQSRRVKFTGKECVTLLSHWDGILDDLCRGDTSESTTQHCLKA